MSPRLGTVDEDFVFQIAGAPDHIVVNVRGEVVGPTFHADVAELDYGVVPFGFVTSRYVTLANTSSIPMEFRVHLPEDCPVRHEFEIDPPAGIITAGSELQIQVDLTPTFSDRCDVHLAVDVVGVGDCLLSIPVFAECVVPEVSLVTPLAEYGHCYLGHPAVAMVQLRNPSALPAKYTTVPPDPAATGVTFTTEPMSGIIAPNATTSIPLSAIARVLGRVQTTCAFSIAGSPERPLSVAISLVGEGPVLTVSAHKLDWKVLQVLTDQPKRLILRNESPIAASFSTRFAPPTACFSVSPATGTLPAGQSCELLVHTALDDTVRFANDLLVEVHAGVTQTVRLQAVGIGSTIVCEGGFDIAETRFGHQFADRECERRYTLRNGGRRTQTITFKLDAPPPNVAGRCTVMRGATFKKKRTPACPNPPDPSRSVFGVWPETATLAPGQTVEVALRGLSHASGRVEETLLVMGVLKGHKEVSVLHRMRVSAHFGTPLIEVSPESLRFHAAKSRAAVLQRETKWVSLKNVSSLPLTAAIAVSGPFRLGDDVPASAVVAPQSELHLEVVYDPAYREDSVTRVDEGQLSIAYAEHTHVDAVALTAEVYYPNLHFSAQEVAFGAILSDTGASRAVTITNRSPMVVHYSWTFVDESGGGGSDAIAQAFDVLPTRGSLQPGESRDTAFTFFGHGSCSCAVVAECIVTDGPRYRFLLSGEAGAESYHLSERTIDFFNVDCTGADGADGRRQSLAVVNDGPIPLLLAVLSDSARVSVEPRRAEIAPASRLDLAVTLLPGVPGEFAEELRVQIGHDAPLCIRVQGSKVFPHVVLDAPRAPSKDTARALAAALAALGIPTPDNPADATAINAEMDRQAVAHTAAGGADGSGDSGDGATAVAEPRRAKLAPYLLALGPIVRGQTLSALVGVTNDTAAAVSFALGRHGLAQAAERGFTASPDKVLDLPAGQTTQLRVQFNPAGSLRRAYPLGEVSHVFRVEVAGGPAVPVLVTATVCVPVLDLSSATGDGGVVDFGAVSVGECRVATVRLTNKQPVPCTWSATRKTERLEKGLSHTQQAARRQEIKAAATFTLFPLTGHLPPGAHQDVSVTYMPTDATPSATRLPIIFEQNPEAAAIDCTGVGRDADLVFSESLLVYGPVMPGGPPQVRSVVVTNNEAVPIEIYSVEADERYREEEGLLLRLRPHFADGRMLLPPRAAGQPLPRELYEADDFAYAMPVLSADGLSEVLQLQVPSTPGRRHLPGLLEVDTPAATPMPGAGVGAAVHTARASQAPAPQPSPAEQALARHRGLDELRARRQHDQGGVNVILSGPSAAGKSTLAARLATTYHCVLLDVDAVVRAAMAGGTPAGRQVREALRAMANVAEGGLPEDVPPPEGSGPAAAAAAPPQGGWQGGEAAQPPLPAAAHVPVDLVAAVLAERVGREDALAGVVVDGLQSVYGPPEAIAHAALLALTRRQHLVFAALRLDGTVCASRLHRDAEAAEAARAAVAAAAAALTPPSPMEEDAYEALSSEAQAAYDALWVQYRRALRERLRAEAEAEAEARRQAEEARQEEEAARKKPAGGGGRKSAVPASSRRTDRGETAAGGQSPKVARAQAPPVPVPAELDNGYAPAAAEELVRFWDRATAGPSAEYAAALVAGHVAGEETPAAGAAPPSRHASGKRPKPPTHGGAAAGEEGQAGVVDLRRPPACVPFVEVDAAAAEEDALRQLLTALPAAAEVERSLGLRPPLAALPAPEDLSVVRLPGERPLMPELRGFSFVDPAVVARQEAEGRAAAAAAAAAAVAGELAVDDGRGSGQRRSVTSASRSRPGSSKPKKTKDPKPGSRRGKRGGGGSGGEEEGGEATEGAKPVVLVDDSLRVPRWVVPARGTVTIVIRYTPTGPGVFDQTFTFETVTSGRQFQLNARAICEYPYVSSAPRDMFPGLCTRKESTFGRYNMATNTMQFGPVLSGKPKENLQSIPHPENSMPIMLHNPTGAEVTVKATMETDETFATYTLEPRLMTIGAGATAELRIWAYPKGSATVKDRVIICVSDNPLPIVINTAVEGVEVGLEFERARGSHSTVAFERTLISRSDTKMLTMHNRSKLPMAWAIAGMEQLGADVTTVATSGVIDALSSFHLPLHFSSPRPTTVKKVVRVEVSDADNQFGVMQTENVTVTAEAYDVALDMAFPRSGPDGELNYEVIRVFDEKTLLCTLRNKGRYDIAYRFFVDAAALERECPGMTEDTFIITPASGTLHPGEKNTSVKITFRTRQECSMASTPLLQCEVVEPFMKETVAKIPVCVSAEAVFSQYALLPARGVNFGCVRHGSAKQTREITIQNTGKTDFKFHISKLSQAEVAAAPVPASGGDGGGGGKKERRPSGLGAITPSGRRSAAPAEKVTSQRFTAGSFTVYPSAGTVPKGGVAKITVEADAQTEGRTEVMLVVDVDQRSPRRHPNGMRYALAVEACAPALDARPETLFDEYRVAQRLDALADVRSPAFSVADNTFSLGPAVVACQGRYRIKLFNSSKVACDVTLAGGRGGDTTPAGRSSKAPAEAIVIEPAQLSIPSREHRYATVVFTPTAIQGYSASFEAAIVAHGGTTGSTPAPIAFAIIGQGVLPRVSLLPPVARTASGQPRLRFRRTLCGHTQTAVLAVRNDGPVAARVTLEAGQGSRRPDTSGAGNRLTVAAAAGVSSRSSAPGTRPVSSRGRRESLSRQSSRRPSSRKTPSDAGSGIKVDPLVLEEEEEETGAAVVLRKAADGPFTLLDGALGHLLCPGETHEFAATFAPQEADTYTSQLMLTVEGNEFEAVFVEARGEGFVADVTVDGLAEDVLDVGDVPVGDHRTVTFALTNHCAECTRFSFPATHAQLSFSPRQGHLLAGHTRQVRATFHPTAPVSLAEQGSLAVAVSRITRVGGTDVGAVEAAAEAEAEWTSDHEVVQWLLQEDGDGRLRRVQDVSAAPEPAHTEHEGSAREISIPCRGFSAWAAHSYPAEALAFPATLALQQDTRTFPLTNSGSVRFTYRWEVEDDDMIASAGATPFSVEPLAGELAAGAMQEMTVRFAPTAAGAFEAILRCLVDRAAPDAAPPAAIAVSGSATQPLVHLELPGSDYVSSGRRDPTLPGPPSSAGGGLPADLRVLEFSSCGIRVVNTISFDLVNPTAAAYAYTWQPVQPTGGGRAGGAIEAGPFRCRSVTGTCPAGGASRQLFEYEARTLDLCEGFWQLLVPTLDLAMDVLLVGHSEEPRVMLDRPTVELPPLPLGQATQATVHLVNEEAQPFAFKFDAAALEAINRGASVSVSPATGTVAAGGRLALTLSFTPRLAQLYNFRLPCRVKSRPTSVVLAVRAEGYDTHAALQNPGDADHPAAGLTASGELPLHFGDVHIKERCERSVVLQNTGKYPYAYSWKLCHAPPGMMEGAVMVSPMEGIVAQGSSAAVDFAFAPKTAGSLQGLTAVCKIRHGPSFTVALVGRAMAPAVQLSSDQVSFGKVFVHRAGMPVQQQTLAITNNDTHQVSLACLYQSTPSLRVDCPAAVVRPGETVHVDLVFAPRAAQAYAETVVFQVNSLVQLPVAVTGTGTPLRLQLEQPMQQAVSFGAVQIGSVTTRTLSLVNRSALPVTFTLAADEEALLACAVGIHPGSTTTLLPKQAVPIRLKFAPTKRTPPFSHEVSLQYLGQLERLLTVSGACQGVDVELDYNQVTFGGVVASGRASRRVLLTNRGDVGAKFKWEVAKLAPWFTISPSEGYVSPGLEVPFSVTFHPPREQADVRCEGIVCRVEGVKRPLVLDLAGVAIPRQAERDALQFHCEVRQTETKAIKINNPTTETWNLAPVIENDCFSGPPQLTVPPETTVAYRLKYSPLSMTTGAAGGRGGGSDPPGRHAGLHNGSVFVALPDGKALLYNLVGQAERPRAIEHPACEVPCKTAYTEQLPVANWLKRSQRFRVTINRTKADASTVLKGFDYVDVPGQETRNYALQFYAYKEGTTVAEVVFRNESTQEYVAYEVTFRTHTGGIVGSLSLSTVTRRATTHSISLENPLPTAVTFSQTCVLLHGGASSSSSSGKAVPCTEIHGPASFRVPPRCKQFNCTFEFLPLRARECSARLTLSSSELGTFQYDLALAASSAPPQPTERLAVQLGGVVTKRYRFTNFSTTRCEYAVRMDGSSDFSAPATVTAAAAVKSGAEVAFDVAFQPSKLGDCKATMIVSSPVGGEYICPLFGQCTAPTPAGPFTVASRGGAKATIPFKNVFASQEAFAYTVDNPAFAVKASDTYKPGETKEIAVRFDAKEGAARMGKLTVTCNGGIGSGVEWVFYLKGA